MGAPQNLGVHPFPDPIGHLGAPWRPFWIFEVLIEGMIESKNLFSESAPGAARLVFLCLNDQAYICLIHL